MNRQRTAIVFALLLGGAAFQAEGAQAPDAARGRLLYERHCGTCHAPGVHGHTQKTPLTRDELRTLVDTFRSRAGLRWTRDEIDDVVEHLNTMSYRLPPEKVR